MATPEERFDGDPRIALSLLLPRDTESVPVVRHLCEQMVTALGASPDATSAITIALTEACSNAIRHADCGGRYRIDVEVGGDRCDIVVAYLDNGFDPEKVGLDPADPTAESGRGLFLMRALVDDLDFTFDPGRTQVRMSKDLEFAEVGPAQRLLRPHPID